MVQTAGTRRTPGKITLFRYSEGLREYSEVGPDARGPKGKGFAPELKEVTLEDLPNRKVVPNCTP